MANVGFLLRMPEQMFRGAWAPGSLVERIISLERSMRITRRDRIANIVKVLEEQMRVLESMGLAESASLLRITWLDLKRRDGSISIEELEALCVRISGTIPKSAAGSKVGPKNRARPAAVRPSRTRALRSR